MSNLVKRTFLFVAIVFSCMFISNYAFANNGTMDNMKNDVRNVVGGAENVVENAAKGTTTTVRDGLDNLGNSTQNAMHNMNLSGSRTSADTSVTRSSANTSNTKTMWTWFIVGIIALIVIGIVWYMATRNNHNSNY